MTDTQNRMILAELKQGKSITPIDALTKHGCFRLSARIYDLRQAGHNITKRMVETDSGKMVAEYRLGQEAA